MSAAERFGQNCTKVSPDAIRLLSVFALTAAVASHLLAAEPVDTAAVQSTRMPGIPRIAYRSFWPQERYNRQFAEAGVKLVFIFPANTVCSINVPYSN